ncbi:MAG: Unknown protein [uncultured Sulfurovum sp.]|uniref:Uncharacterized protein n=1 Tax=uncultured Sulfurovum sp. TaxID=269237 RepID=A0A6S6SV31_9BACT|nr:MAG: Unknown protein [uncultured Sulfurovum sp.]
MVESLLAKSLNQHMVNQTYSKMSEKDKLVFLDHCTPIFQYHMDRLAKIEQSIIYYLAIPDRRSLTKDILPKKQTNLFLSKKLRVESKSLSVYLKRLFDNGLISREKINDKNYIYSIKDIILIDWLRMREPNKKTILISL